MEGKEGQYCSRICRHRKYGWANIWFVGINKKVETTGGMMSRVYNDYSKKMKIKKNNVCSQSPLAWVGLFHGTAL